MLLFIEQYNEATREMRDDNADNPSTDGGAEHEQRGRSEQARNAIEQEANTINNMKTFLLFRF